MFARAPNPTILDVNTIIWLVKIMLHPFAIVSIHMFHPSSSIMVVVFNFDSMRLYFFLANMCKKFLYKTTRLLKLYISLCAAHHFVAESD